MNPIPGATDDDPMAPEGLVDIQQAARFLHVKVSWLYEQVRLDRVPSYKLGGFRRFRLSELEAWVRGNGKPDRLVPDQEGNCKHP